MTETALIIIAILILILLGIILFMMTRRRTGGSGEDTYALRQEVDTLKSEKSAAGERNLILEKQLREKEEKTAADNLTIIELNKRISELVTDQKNLQERIALKEKEIIQTEEKLREAFRNLANEIFEDKSKKFTEQNRAKLEEILNPLGEKIKEFRQKVEETYDKESKQRFSLEKEIKNLADLNRKISEDAQNLTVALKSDSKKQGNWGELVLERVLESSGLVKGLEYTREFATRSDQGDMYRPDVIVNLPDNKHIIIDSKVSLIAYNDFVSTDSAEEKDKFLKLHILSIKNHVKLLSEKNYQNLEAFDTPDYVLLFIPIESSFSVALQSDPELFNFAWDKNVVIVSPTTLLATLKTVASIWKHEKQTQNAIEIARQGGLLYDKFVSFLNDLEKVGSQLEATKRTYDEAHKKLSTGSGNIIGKVEKLREMGAKASKELPKGLLEKADED